MRTDHAPLDYASPREPEHRRNWFLIVGGLCSGMCLIAVGAAASTAAALIVARHGFGGDVAILFGVGLPFLAAGCLRTWHVIRALRGLPDLERRRERL